MKIIYDFTTGTILEVGNGNIMLIDTDQFTDQEVEDIYLVGLPGDHRVEVVTGFTTEPLVKEDI